jgi:mRNA-degrading endonuclease RelE of RelBE toxin-antitoxin system
MYKVLVAKKVTKKLRLLPKNIQKIFAVLVEDLREFGPILKHWQNFSELKKHQYHCHLSHKWVACWYWEENTIEIEVYYAGSRENAPY